MENLYQDENSKKLDPRAVFIIQGYSNQPVYIWQGEKVPLSNLDSYINSALEYIKFLQKYEQAGNEVLIVK